ncbi:MAG TPA: hypothetical protein DGG94_14250, partial [Micromonosporaceae bacterium]|nr:hypothetical protein [Micromonosporaceae bacterium]
GERAEAFALETESGFKYAEYKIHAREDNLVIEVWLAVGGDTLPPKSHTGGIVRHISDSTYRALYFLWRTKNGMTLAGAIH